MRTWPRIREGIITAWHSILDYDAKSSRSKREKKIADRARAKKNRLRIDAKYDAIAATRKREREAEHAEQLAQSVEVMAPYQAGQREVAEYRIPAPRRGHGICPACGSGMKKGARSTDSGSGCLIMIVGLILAPVLIGIPLLLIGLHYMSKRQGFWRCRNCGMETGRDVGFFELTM